MSLTRPTLVALLSSTLAFAHGAAAQTEAAVIYDNGPIITGGPVCLPLAPWSELQNAIPMSLGVFGFNANAAANFSVADDFTVCGTWTITDLEFFTYQTSGLPPTITGVYVRIWDSDPRLATANTVFPVGVTRPWSANLAGGTLGALHSYRAVFPPVGCTRPVQLVSVPLALVLAPGVYWMEVKFDGDTTLTGPWVPPVSVLGCRSTGNALQNAAANLAGTWGNAGTVLNNSTTTVPAGVGIPFRVVGTAVGQALASAATFGVGKNCTNGVGAWDLGNPVRTPILGRDYLLRVVNGVAGSVPVVLASPTCCALPVPCIGTVYICPPWVAFVMPTFHATQFDSILHLPIPHGANLCGACLCLQAFWLDPLPACCGWGHSDGLTLCLGN